MLITLEKIQPLFESHKLPTPQKMDFLGAGVHINLKITTQNKVFVLRTDNFCTTNSFIYREAAIYSFLSKFSLPIPEVIVVGHQPQLFPYVYMIQNHLPGANGYTLWDEKQTKLATALGNMLYQLHQIPTDTFAEEPWCDPNSWQEKLISLCLSYLKNCEFFPKKIAQRIGDVLPKCLPFIPKKVSPCLLHRDFKPHNVLVSQKDADIIGIVDFEWAHLGDPLLDIASVESYFEPWHKDFLAGYYTKNLPPHHLQKTLAIYSLINLVHVITRSPQVIDGAKYFALIKMPAVTKMLEEIERLL